MNADARSDKIFDLRPSVIWIDSDASGEADIDIIAADEVQVQQGEWDYLNRRLVRDRKECGKPSRRTFGARTYRVLT